MTSQEESPGDPPHPGTRYRPSNETWRHLAIYLVVVISILSVAAVTIHRYGPGFIEFVLQFLLPDNWLFAGRKLVDRLLDAQSLVVLINTGMATVIVLVSLITFSLKERVSASYEQDTRCSGGRTPNELPLWRQALEECELGIFYVTLTLLVLRLGLSESDTWRTVSIVLSHLLLATTMAIDYISPTLQRHGLTYTGVLATLGRHPLKTLGFGVLFAAGPVATGYVFKLFPVDPIVFYVTLATFHIACLSGAVLVGTLIGGRLVAEALERPKLGPAPRVATWLLIISTLFINGVFFGAAGHAIYGLSPVMKCSWSLEQDSLRIHDKTFLPPSIILGATISIHNPTKRPATLGAHHIDVLYKGEPITTTRLTQFEVQPGQRVTQAMRVSIRQQGGVLQRLVRTGTSIKQHGVRQTFEEFITPAHYSVRIILPTPVGDLPIRIKSNGSP